MQRLPSWPYLAVETRHKTIVTPVWLRNVLRMPVVRCKGSKKNNSFTNIQLHTEHISLRRPSRYPWGFSPGSDPGPWSWSNEYVQSLHPHWSHSWSCTRPEPQPKDHKQMTTLWHWHTQVISGWSHQINKNKKMSNTLNNLQPLAVRRHSVFSWCSAEGGSGFLWRYSTLW